MDLTHPLSASFGHSNVPDGDIYGFGGCEDLSTRIWFLSYDLPSNFSMIFRRVSIYFVEDCLRKGKIRIFGKTGGSEKKNIIIFIEKIIFSKTLAKKKYKFDM